jgi:hypothetical protein
LETTQKIYGFYIYGITLNGDTFRPSDWVDRLCGIMASFVPEGFAANSMCYSPYVEPFILKYEENNTQKEARVVRVDYKIAAIESKALIFLKDFAKSNQLKTEMIYQPIVHEGL